MLSPLRFHYDSETFGLPARLGLINSAGTQDLIVHVLARSRYEMANYENFAIPTNIRVNDTVKASLGTVYASLFDKVLAKHPQAVVTEYAWSAGSGDPCTEPPLNVADLATLGVDALPGYEGAKEAPPEIAYLFVLTRLHTRYDSNALGEDLVFRAAPGIMGGNGVPDPEGVEDEHRRRKRGEYAVGIHVGPCCDVLPRNCRLTQAFRNRHRELNGFVHHRTVCPFDARLRISYCIILWTPL